MKPKLKVLFLPRWYPNRNDPMPGLFIQRQAEALTRYCDVAVIYVHPEPDCPNKYEVEFSEENEVRALRVYYRSSTKGFSFLRNLLKVYRFYRANFKALKSIRQFNPDLVHAHVLTRMGIIAYRISRRWKKPFLISDHWSRYFPENDSYKGIARRWMTRLVVRKANAVIVVSEMLQKSMQNWKLWNTNYFIIPNVVETEKFILPPKKEIRSIKRIIHVSCFEDKSKNISGFLRAVKSLFDRRNDFECLVVGDGPDYNQLLEYRNILGIPETMVVFTGLKTGKSLVEAYQSSDFLVLSSHYETFGTVIVEGMSCGLPVIATHTGIAPEIITVENGLIVPPRDEIALTDAMDLMMSKIDTYDGQKVRATVLNRFTKEIIADSLYKLYQEISVQTTFK